MQPTIFRNTVEEAALVIRAGGLAAFPTETVYGLGANALDAAAVELIFIAKGRPKTSPLIVHVASIEQARELALDWPDDATALAERFWPGPLTLIVRKHSKIPDIVTAGLPSVALRIPSHPIALELLRAAAVPIAAPSANRFTELSPTTAEHVRRSFGQQFPIVDGGPADIGIESTVFAVEGLRLLRPGMISREQIEAIVGPVNVESGAESPGQHPRHYQPRTPVILTRELPQGMGAYVWHTHEIPSSIGVRMPSDAAGYAASLYRTLHELDTKNLQWIAIEPPPDNPAWDGIRDRLTRASCGAANSGRSRL